MDYLKLDPTVRDRVEAEVGSDVPDPNSSEFEAFLETLKDTRPELVDALVQGLDVEGADLPEEVQLRKAKRREGRRNLLRQLFYSNNYEDEPNLNKRKTLAVIVGVLVALLPIAFVVDLLAEQRGMNTTVSQESEPAPSTFQVAQDPVPVETQLPETLPSTPPRALPAQDDLPPAPGPVNPDIANAPPSRSLGSSAPLTLGNQRVTPVQLPALSLFDAPPSSPTALTVVAPPPAPGQLGLVSSTQSANAPTEETPSGTQNLNLIQEALSQAEPSSLSFLTEQRLSEGTELTIAAQTELESADAVTETSSPPLSLRETAVPSEEQSALNSAERTNPIEVSSSETQATTVTLQPGAQLPAQLMTGIIVTEGVSSPVVAETPANGKWCDQEPCPAITWLGTARLERPGRVSLRFEQAVIDGEARAVRASAFGQDKLPGLAAAMSDASPTVVQDLLRAAAGGVSDYLEAVANQQKVTITEGNVVVEDLEVPSIDSFLLGRAAKLFDVPSDQTTIVRVAQVAPGTPLTIFVGTSD